jgi:hypothetical protein
MESLLDEKHGNGPRPFATLSKAITVYFPDFPNQLWMGFAGYRTNSISSAHANIFKYLMLLHNKH